MTQRDIVARHRRAFQRLRQAIIKEYSYRSLRRVNWRARFARFGPALCSVRTAREFAVLAARLLSAARDIHLWLRVEGKQMATYTRCAKWNINLRTLPRQIPGWRRRNATVFSGKFPDGTHYLCLRSWPANAAKKLEPAYRVLRQASATSKRLIIDVRANGGGSEPLAARLAGCFVRHSVRYAKHLNRHAGKFSRPVIRWLKPNVGRPRYRGRVAALIGPGTVSSCESFALMMKQVPGCKLIGQRTAGASGNPKPFDLGNGVVLLVPSWKNLTLAGVGLEGRGVAPDIEVNPDAGAFAQGDPVITAALAVLRGHMDG